MVVEINNEPYNLPDSITVSDMFSYINRDTKGIALAINEEVISKSDWSSKKINNHDKVLLIRATQGG